jgi:hypothetical protein
MAYETSRLLAYQSYQHWISSELFSTGWFVMVAVLAVTYAVWLKLVDKSRIRDLILFGSLLAVGFSLAGLILEGYYGLWEYQVSLLPLKPTVFIVSYTIAPILFMTVAQYTTSWKSYLVWGSIGAVVITFGLVPIYSMLGIVKFHDNFNNFYNFIMYMTGGIIGRAIYLWLVSIEQSQVASSPVIQPFYGLQPAASKPLREDNDDKTDNGK